jgi:hypothetical protein
VDECSREENNSEEKKISGNKAFLKKTISSEDGFFCPNLLCHPLKSSKVALIQILRYLQHGSLIWNLLTFPSSTRSENHEGILRHKAHQTDVGFEPS